MLVQEIELTKNKADVPWRGRNVYVNDSTGVIYDPVNQDIVGKKIIVVKGGKRQTMYKITDKDFEILVNFQRIITNNEDDPITIKNGKLRKKFIEKIIKIEALEK